MRTLLTYLIAAPFVLALIAVTVYCLKAGQADKAARR